MVIALALGAALKYGVSDIMPGLPSRRASLWAVAVSWPAASRRLPADLVSQLVASAPSQLVALTVAFAAIALTVVRRDVVAYRRNP